MQEENARGVTAIDEVLSKSKGHVLRLSAMMFALDQGLSRLSPESEGKGSDDANESELNYEGATWSTTITKF